MIHLLSRRILFFLLLAVFLTAYEAGAQPTVKDGHVFLDGKELDVTLNDVPPNIDNGIKTWAAIPYNSDGDEEGGGAWFFDGDGKSVAFLPNDELAGYADVLWAPAGDRLALVSGSGIRPDINIEIYVGMVKQTDISVLRGVEGTWLADGKTFIATRIDDTREGKDFGGRAYGFKLSVVLHDSEKNVTTPLKEATDTQNFSFNGVSKDGKSIAVTEEFVKTPLDWGGDEPSNTREITVPLPTAN
jgi:hypothetical protein